MSVPLMNADSAVKFGTVIVGAFRAEISISGKIILADSVSLNFTSTYLLSTNCCYVVGGFLTLAS